MSARFKETLLECLNSSKPVLATIRSSNNAFTDQLKKLPDTQTILLTKTNAASVRAQIRKWMDGHL
jgi:nucleoside-triphosphatase THEP1